MNVTTTISGPVVLGLISIIAGIVAIIRLLLQAKNEVKLTKIETKKTSDKIESGLSPISNGFTSDVLSRLARIESNIDMLNTTMTDHLEYHVQHDRIGRR